MNTNWRVKKVCDTWYVQYLLSPGEWRDLRCAIAVPYEFNDRAAAKTFMAELSAGNRRVNLISGALKVEGKVL